MKIITSLSVNYEHPHHLLLHKVQTCLRCTAVLICETERIISGSAVPAQMFITRSRELSGCLSVSFIYILS